MAMKKSDHILMNSASYFLTATTAAALYGLEALTNVQLIETVYDCERFLTNYGSINHQAHMLK